MKNSHPPKPKLFFKGFPEDVRFRGHTVPESLELARGSLYQAWFDALQLSPFYADGIDNGLWRSDEARDTYQVFGDLRELTFDHWWVERGYKVFAEQHDFRRVVVSKEPGQYGSEGPSISLEIPLNVSPATLKRQFDSLLREHHPHYRDFDRWQASTARVRFENRKLTSVSINLYLKVYRYWLESQATGGVQLYEIGEALNLDPKHKVLRSDYPREASAKHLKMSLLVTEYLEKSKNLVAHATEGRFPCTDNHEWIERKSRAPRTASSET